MTIVLQLHFVKVKGSLTLEGISLKNLIEVKGSFLSKPEAIPDTL